jgi:hypothetical protein
VYEKSVQVTNWAVREIFPDSRNFDASSGRIGSPLSGNQDFYKAFTGRITDQSTAK